MKKQRIFLTLFTEKKNNFLTIISMNKVHVFNAGPCLLPQVVLDNAKAAIDNFAGTGVSLLCISHRTKEWEAVMDET